MATGRRSGKIDVEAVLAKIERELRAANEGQAVTKITITLDVGAIRSGASGTKILVARCAPL